MIGELVEWLRTEDDDAMIAEGRFDLGGGDMVTAVDYQPSGYDAQPEPGDFAILVPASESGSYVIVAWVDPWNEGVTKPGEVRLYARVETDVVAAIHVTTDGEKPDGPLMELIARADRVDAVIKVIWDALQSATATIGAADSGALYRANILFALGQQGKTGCDKVYVT